MHETFPARVYAWVPCGSSLETQRDEGGGGGTEKEGGGEREKGTQRERKGEKERRREREGVGGETELELENFILQGL